MPDNKRNHFLFFRNYYEAARGLKDKDRLALYDAIIGYSLNGDELDITGIAKSMFALILPSLRKSRGNAISGAKGGKAKAENLASEVPSEQPGETLADDKQTSGETPTYIHQESFTNVNEKEESISNEIEKEEEEIRGSGAAAPAPSQPLRPKKQKYGEYGWVKLTEAEYIRLVSDFGEDDTARYIALVDEKAQQTGNKNKWVDWNLTIRKAIREKWGGTYAGHDYAHTGNHGDNGAEPPGNRWADLKVNRV